MFCEVIYFLLLSLQVEEEADGAVVMCVVQNKIDLIDEATMTP